MDLTSALKDQAHRLGFSLVGVTTPDPLPHYDVFRAWLVQGRHGDMSYLATGRSQECRLQPKKILPECRSVLVLGWQYANPKLVQAVNQPGSPLSGRVAAYAWGEDYHDVVTTKLRELVRFIETQAGQPVFACWYTDTGPILERELAQRAGLGWIGKNTCLISPSGGSYFFLAEILLGLELDPDPPFIPDRCGTCQRCMRACPTGCILPDRTLDARSCISYLTIELKGAIPLELRTLVGSWVFGCDICQQVCPWNRFATTRPAVATSLDIINPTPDLITELSLTAGEFNARYRHSPVRRAKRRGYLRNIAVALGNTRNPQGVPALAGALQANPEPLVRAHAAWALGQISEAQARRVLGEAARREPDPMVKSEIHSALASL